MAREETGRQSHIFILSAPSGAGKNTLIKALLREVPCLWHSVSCTTRPPRPGEREGEEYYFLSEKAFREKVSSGEFAEWAKVHGHLYGTSARRLEEMRARGFDVVLDIDVQGARQLKARYPEAVTIFIMPPSIEALRKRLRGRRGDAEDEIERRLKVARAEIEERDFFEHVIANDNFEDALRELKAIFLAKRGEPFRGS
ncbi:MAG: guanylate kinase [Nitrospinota bacterium]